MIVTTFPWHWVGILGMPRRMAYYDYADAALQPRGASGRAVGARRLHPAGLRPAVPVHPGARPPRAARRRPGPTGSASPSIRRAPSRRALNGHALWLALMIGADGDQLRLSDRGAGGAPGHVGAGRLRGSATMSAAPPFSFRNPWFSAGVGVTAAVLFLSAPSPASSCCPSCSPISVRRAFGTPFAAPPAWPQPSTVGSRAPSRLHRRPTSCCARIPGAPEPASIGRGATLAQRCAICHGPTGVSRADSPNLAGQYAGVVYKELLDFRAARAPTRHVAVRRQPFRPGHARPRRLLRLPAAPSRLHPERARRGPAIVIDGAPIRDIPPCGACHGALDNKTGSPWLEGQSAVYLKEQLQAFASGQRTTTSTSRCATSPAP